MSKVSPLLLVVAFISAVLVGAFIASAELGLAGTVLAGFAAAAVLIVVGLALELRVHGPRTRVHLSRG